jgi:hypothetical protein
MPPTKKAYLAQFPLITHIPTTKSCTIIDPFFNPQYNDWYYFTPPDTHHPINDLHPNINPFRNLFAELIETGSITWDGKSYTFGNPKGFWHTCKRYNINPKYPPVPTFTAPTTEPTHFKLIAEYYSLFATYNQISSSSILYCVATPLQPLSTTFQFPLIAKPSTLAKRTHYIECSDTSTSDEENNIISTKRYKTDNTNT